MWVVCGPFSAADNICSVVVDDQQGTGLSRNVRYHIICTQLQLSADSILLSLDKEISDRLPK